LTFRRFHRRHFREFFTSALVPPSCPSTARDKPCFRCDFPLSARAVEAHLTTPTRTCASHDPAVHTMTLVASLNSSLNSLRRRWIRLNSLAYHCPFSRSRNEPSLSLHGLLHPVRTIDAHFFRSLSRPA